MSRAVRGMGRVFQPFYVKNGERRQTNTWYVEYCFRGKQIRESSGSTTRVDATRLLKKRMGEIGKGEFVSPHAERTTLAEILEMVETDLRINGRSSLPRVGEYRKHLFAFFGLGARVVLITPDRIDKYKEARLSEGAAAAATVNRELSCLRRGLRLGLRAGKVSRVPPIVLLSEHNIRQGFFERPAFEAMLKELAEDLRPVVTFAYLTGWRRGEILSLQWRQVDFTAGMVRLEPETAKNDEGRTFPFAALPELEALLRRQRERTTVLERVTGQVIPWVFHRGGRSIKDFRGAWEGACNRAGVTGRIPHDFRRTAVRNLERAGVPRSVAMKLTGHKTESVYRRYAIVNEADLAEGVKKLALLHKSDAKAPHKVVALRPAGRSRATKN